MKAIYVFAICILPFFLRAQLDPCQWVDRLMQDIDRELTHTNYDIEFIISKLNSARVMARDCPSKEEAVKHKYDDLYVKLEEQRRLADKLKRIAQREQEKNEEISLANGSAVNALKIARYNPTVGLRMAQYLMRKYPEGATIAQAFHDIISDTTNLYFKVLLRQEHKVTCLAFSPDDRQLVVGLDTSVFFLCDRQGNILRYFRGHRGPITSLVFSPDGRHILSGSKDWKAILWDTTGRKRQVFSDHRSAVRAVAFSPDGQSFVTGSHGTVIVSNIEGHKLQTLKSHRGAINAITFSPDGKHILTASSDRMTILWDTLGNQLHTLVSKQPVISLAFDRAGKEVILGYYDGSCQVWDPQQNRTRSIISSQSSIGYQDYKYYIGRDYQPTEVKISFSPPGHYVLTTDGQDVVNLWNREGQLRKQLLEHPVVTATAFSADGQYFLTGSSDGVIKLWDIRGCESYTFEGRAPVKAARFSPNDDYILTSFAGSAILWDRQGHQVLTIDGYQDVEAIAFLPDDEQHILTASLDTIKHWVWDLEANTLTLRSVRPIRRSDEDERIFHDMENPAFSKVSFSPDCRHLLKSGYVIRVAGMWGDLLDSDTIQERSLTGQPGFTTDVAFSPEGKYVIVGFGAFMPGLENNAIVFTSNAFNSSARSVRTFKGHQDIVSAVAISKDGKYALTGSYDKTVKLWDVQSGEELYTLAEHIGMISALAFSPDHRYFLSGSADQTAKLWDLEAGAVLQTFAGHDSTITHLSFSSDGLYFLIGSAGKIKMYKSQDYFLRESVEQISIREMIQNGLKVYKKDLRHYIDSDSTRQEDLIEIADFYFDQKDWKNAKVLYDKLVELDRRPNYLFRLMVIHDKIEAPFTVNTSVFLQSEDLQTLKECHQYFSRKKAWKEAMKFAQKIWLKEDTPENRYDYYLSSLHVGIDRFEELFLSGDGGELRTYWRLLTNQEPGLSNAELIQNFENGLEVAEAIIVRNGMRMDSTRAAADYNTLGWYQLLAGDFAACEASIRRGIALDPENKILYTNLPPALLFQGEFEEAKTAYLEKIDEVYMPPRGFPTYREIFLKDISVFESEGIVPEQYEENLEKMKSILRAYPEIPVF